MLDDRKMRVLRAVVEDYVSTVEPVGSRTIARKYSLGVSPATIRNEMADLEEMGYLEQPHTSSGRVPSDLGYRYYVDWLMPQADLSSAVIENIHRVLEEKTREIQALIQQTVKVLSDTTRYLAFVLGPQLDNARLHRLSIVPLMEGSALLVLVTDTGFVQTSVIDRPAGLADEEIHGLYEALSERLRGVPVDLCADEAVKVMNRELSAYKSVMREALDVLRSFVDDDPDERVYVGGTSRLFEQPEFRDVDKARAVLGMLEHDQTVRELVNSRVTGQLNDGSVMVSIGGETGVKEIEDCSLVGTVLAVGGRSVGKIAVLGPRRMEYARVIAIVKHVQSKLSEALSKGAG
ncbi:MAG: heat-inducible transcription repressor HrcA [Firmicutes bacterium]|nr:heat-inducible transcription repressor HrcA [Bacillota bacterium]